MSAYADLLMAEIKRACGHDVVFAKEMNLIIGDGLSNLT